jgi:flagellar biosynthesis/type III secretory pathway chaperone
MADREALHRILDRHNDALGAFREAARAFDEAVDSIRDTMIAVRAANQAQGHAIEAMLAANREALTLLNNREK